MTLVEGERVILTGASRGLGRTLTSLLVKRGFHVAALSRSRERLSSLKEELAKEKGELLTLPTDITREDMVRERVREVERVFGGLDILINNAAYHQSLPLEETPLKVWEETLAVNLTGSFLLIREVLPLLKREGGGSILSISSTAAHTYFPGFGAYSASKGGLNSLSMVLAGEVRDQGIRVFTLDLGLVNTEYTRSRIEEGDPKRWLQPEEVGEVVLFLLSREGRPLHGSTIHLHGERK